MGGAAAAAGTREIAPAANVRISPSSATQSRSSSCRPAPGRLSPQTRPCPPPPRAHSVHPAPQRQSRSPRPASYIRETTLTLPQGRKEDGLYSKLAHRRRLAFRTRCDVRYRRRSMFGSLLPASAVAAAACAAGLWTAGSTVLQAQAKKKTIYVSAPDRNKKPVETLQPEDITIREDNAAREILRIVPA